MKVQCAVPSCSERVIVGHFMCMAHWRKVSPGTQSRVHSTLRKWKRRCGAAAEFIEALHAAKLEARAS